MIKKNRKVTIKSELDMNIKLIKILMLSVLVGFQSVGADDSENESMKYENNISIKLSDMDWKKYYQRDEQDEEDDDDDESQDKPVKKHHKHIIVDYIHKNYDEHKKHEDHKHMHPIDHDGDGVYDHLDLDADNDGIPDAMETHEDTDNDGIPNHLDPDSDGDGISDIDESGGTDNNGDGQVDDNTDTDNDGQPDIVDPDNGGTPLPPVDTDGDGINDPVDSSDNDPCLPNPMSDACLTADSDSDGILDKIDTDDDNDGVPDVIEGNTDLDGDGIPNNRDLDSDGDGINDLIEAGGIDTNNDGMLDDATDTDADGLADIVDSDNGGTALPMPDADNDGLIDLFESNIIDTDGDGVTNNSDGDSDGDGIPDLIEGIADNGLGVKPVDTDFDRVPDYLDLDTDNDGIVDLIEAGGSDANGDGRLDDLTDTDADGIADSVDPDNMGTVLPVPDTDNDGFRDFRDLDSDGDGIYDLVEAGGTDVNNDGRLDSSIDRDNDGDGLLDLVDPDAGGTPLQLIDSDGDGINDVLDPADVRPPSQAPTAADIDGDNVLNADDLDTDNDGISNLIEGDGDADGDGIPNSEDLDSDNDGIFDIIEAGIVDNDEDGRVNDFVDVNGNGLTDALDGEINSVFIPVDTDNDGIPDFLDLDSDADNFPDAQEQLKDFDGDGIPDYIDKSTALRTAPVGFGAIGWELMIVLSLLLLLRVATLKKRVKKLTVLLPFLTLVFFSSTSHASIEKKLENAGASIPTQIWQIERWYLGFDLGFSKLDAKDSNSSFINTDESSRGFRIDVGYDWSKSISHDFFYLNPGSTRVRSADPSIGTLGSLRYRAAGIGVDYHPIWRDKVLVPNLKLGIAALSNSATDDRINFKQTSDLSLYFGLGVSWRYQHDWAVNAEWVTYDKDLMFFSVGLRKYFGEKKIVVISQEPTEDSDDDGVPNFRDQCQNTPAGRIVGQWGCQLDDDKDSIVNALDQCPNSKPHTKVDSKGCKIPEVIILHGVNFETNSAKLKPDSKIVLDSVADILTRYPKMKVEIAGHTDNRGDAKFNTELSKSRSDSVQQYLVRMGVNPDNMATFGYGGSKPIDDANNEDAWMINRRVEVHLLNK